ncbi:hypothetical protein [Candidatus Poriferisodalis sp.]|uniref:hypothetical protein n=1 Tax=Candidatus Poriferisodalis sp. TaxID=3101277 RepID=UPI003C6F0014
MALEQAAAEDAWGTALQEHAEADEALREGADAQSSAAHDGEHSLLLEARAAVIVATAKASAACG